MNVITRYCKNNIKVYKEQYRLAKREIPKEHYINEEWRLN